MPYSSLSHLECSRTGTSYDADEVQGVSEVGAPLLARYDLERVRDERHPRGDRRRDRPTLWRYHEVLPVRDPAHVTTLGEGMTPLLPLPSYGAAIGVPGLLMKDEGLIPTGTFKARGAAVGVVPRARARREGGRDADERQRRRRLVGVRRARRPRQPDRDARRRTRDHPARVRGCRRRAVPRRRTDQPRRRAGQGRRRGARPATRRSRRSRSRTASRARRRWATRSPSSSAGRCRT